MPRAQADRSFPHRPTLKEVARLAGVSAMTVSGVLRDPADGYPVTPETRARVEAAAAKLGYRPNRVARAMRNRHFHDIGLLVVKPPQYLPMMPPAMAGVFDELNAAHYQLTLIGLPPGTSADRLPKSFAERSIDALIVDYSMGVPREIRQLVTSTAFPHVALNHRDEVNAVFIDDYTAAVEATRSLVERQRKRIAFFSFETRLRDQHYSFDERRRGFFTAMSEAGLPAREISVPERPGGHKVAIEMLRGTPRPDALVCYSDADAVFVQRALLRLQLRVPDDVALVSFQGDAYGYSPVELTMMRIPWYQIGGAAAAMALEAAKAGSNAEIPSREFKAVLSLGRSC
jgi:DNA-binding LacI/PurR family transcriptional regulator